MGSSIFTSALLLVLACDFLDFSSAISSVKEKGIVSLPFKPQFEAALVNTFGLNLISLVTEAASSITLKPVHNLRSSLARCLFTMKLGNDK